MSQRLPLRVAEAVWDGHYVDAWEAVRVWAWQTLADAPLHVLIECLLIGWVVYLILTRKRRVSTALEKLDPQVVQELCDDWKPEPLVSPGAVESEAAFPRPPVVQRFDGPYLMLEDDPARRLLNFASFDFLGLSGNARVVQSAKEGVRKYGVGSCGPRGFYGTYDAHLKMEAELAQFFGVEEAIVFSSAYATVSSTIPAFCKRGDIVICDKGVSHSLQTGVLLSRSNPYWFKHNDPEDLERVLLEIEQEQKQKKVNLDKPQQRKFVIVEGLYPNYGDMAPLPRYLELKKRFHFRLLVDDSYGFGSLGKTGRGTVERLGLAFTDIDIVTSSLSNSLGSVGGFCVGKKEVVYHQRLNAAGYCFSASSPPYLLVAASSALELVKPALCAQLAANVAALRTQLRGLTELVAHGHDESPIVHLRLKRSSGSRVDDNWVLQRISDECMRNGVCVPRARYVDGEKYQPPPSLRITVNALHTADQIKTAVDALQRASLKVSETRDK